MHRLLPYLPDGGSEAAESLITINRDLDGILLLGLPEVWAAVRSDSSIVTFLESYLRNALRPFDDGFQELSDIEHAVWRHAAALFVKLLGVRGAGIPAHADRSALLSRLLTVPCMLDACSLFNAAYEENSISNSNTKTAQNQLSSALSGMISLKPKLNSELAPAAVTIAENLLEVVEACLIAAPAARKDPEMLTNLVDGVAYAKDACLSLCALIKTYPAAAGLFLKDTSCQQLIEALGAVHDQLLPIIENIAASGLARGKESPLHANLAKTCLQTEIASEVAVAKLVTHAYLDPSIEDITGGSSSSSGAGGSGSFSSVMSKKPGQNSYSNPAAIQRGEALLHAFTLLGHREGASTSTGTGSGGFSLGPALAHRHGMGGTIQAAVMAGVVVLDEAQTDYIAALLDVSSLATAPVLVANNSNTSTNNVNNSTTDGGGGAGSTRAGAGGSGSGNDDDSAVLITLVSQVKDLLPNFGEGFIASCLDILDRNPERVINALLEGNLPQEVESVDSQLTFAKYQEIQKGKQLADAAFPVLPGTISQSTSNAINQQQQNQQQKKINNDSLTAKYLDTKEVSYAEKIKVAAIQSQWEYEDEYDDSYDELLHIGADGISEGEGLGEEDEENRNKQPSATSAGATAAATAALRGLNLGGADAGSSAGRGGRGTSSSSRGGGGGGRTGGRGPRGKGGKLWVLDGRIYNYAKPGAKEVANEAEAQAALQEAVQAAKEIHGLGPGGNKPGARRMPSAAGPSTGAAQEKDGEESRERQPSGDGDGGRDGGRGGGRGGGAGRGSGSGGGTSSHKYKDKNKTAIGNHHRKDRAAQKMSRGM